MFVRPQRVDKLRVQDFKNHFIKHDQVREYRSHSSKVHSVGWNSEGSKLASGSFDRTVNIFSFDKFKLQKEYTFRGHEGSVDQLCWHPSNPSLLATASCDKSVRIWDVRTDKSVSTITTKGENINITWSRNGRTIAVGNKEDLITFIDPSKFSIIAEKQFSFEVNEITFNSEGDLFFLTTGDGSFQVFSYPSLEVQYVQKAHPGTCICIKIDPSGSLMALGAIDSLVSLWELKDFSCVRTFSRLEWPVRSVSFSHDGLLLATASEDLFIDIAYVHTGEQVAKAAIETPTFTVDWHPKQYILAYACDEKDSNDRKKDGGLVKLFGFTK